MTPPQPLGYTTGDAGGGRHRREDSLMVLYSVGGQRGDGAFVNKAPTSTNQMDKPIGCQH